MKTLETSINRLASSIEDLVDLMIMEKKLQKESDVITEAEILPTVKQHAAEIKKLAVGYVRSSKITNDAVKSILTNLNISRIDEFKTHQEIDSFAESLDKLVNRND